MFKPIYPELKTPLQMVVGDVVEGGDSPYMSFEWIGLEDYLGETNRKPGKRTRVPITPAPISPSGSREMTVKSRSCLENGNTRNTTIGRIRAIIKSEFGIIRMRFIAHLASSEAGAKDYIGAFSSSRSIN